MLNRFLHLFFGFFFLASSGLPAMLFPREKILEYKSTIDVDINGILDITEEITVFSEGRNIKRGIFRDFPRSGKIPPDLEKFSRIWETLDNFAGISEIGGILNVRRAFGNVRCETW